MEKDNLKQQLKELILLGYGKEELIQIITTVPTLFNHTPEELKAVLDSISADIKTEEKNYIFQEPLRKEDMINSDKDINNRFIH